MSNISWLRKPDELLFLYLSHISEVKYKFFLNKWKMPKTYNNTWIWVAEKDFHNQLEAVLQKNSLAIHKSTRLRDILGFQKNKVCYF